MGKEKKLKVESIVQALWFIIEVSPRVDVVVNPVRTLRTKGMERDVVYKLGVDPIILCYVYLR